MPSQAGPTMSKEYIESPDGTLLSLRCWRPRTVRAIVAFVKEPGSNAGRYEGIALALATQGVISYALDPDQAKESSVAKSDASLFEHHLADLRIMTAGIRQRHPMRPLFAFGYGASALTVCFHALLRPPDLDGVVCEAAMLDPPWRATIFRKYPWLAPAFSTARMGLVRADGRLRENLRGLSLPLLLLHGSDDAMAPTSGSEYLHRYAGSHDRTLLVFEGGDHDLINGCDHVRVRRKICQWIEGQLAPGGRQRIGIEYINE